MAVCLQDIIPRAIVLRQPKDDDTDYATAGGDAPSDSPVMDAIALPPIRNPMSSGMNEVGSARQFLHLIEHFIHEAEGSTSQRPALAPTTQPDEEIMSRSPDISAAAAMIADWLGRDCRGDMLLMGRVLDRFWSKFSIERFRSPDLSSLVLMAYEEVLMEEGGRKTEGLEAWPALRLRPQALDKPLHEPLLCGAVLMTRQTQTAPAMIVSQTPAFGRADAMADEFMPEQMLHTPAALPPGLAEPALSPVGDDEVEVRLISIREMLRKYLQSRPMEYPQVLAQVLRIPIDEMDKEENVRARLAGELARRGQLGFAMRMWQEVRARQTKSSDAKNASPALWGASRPQRKQQRPWWSLAPRWAPDELDEKLLMLARWIQERGNRPDRASG